MPGLRAGALAKLTFGKALPEVRVTVLLTIVAALVLTFAVLLAALAVEATRLVTFLLAAIFGAGFLATTLWTAFEAGLDGLATTFLDAVALTDLIGFSAAVLGFAVVRGLDFEVEGALGFDAVFDFGFANFVCA